MNCGEHQPVGKRLSSLVSLRNLAVTVTSEEQLRAAFFAGVERRQLFARDTRLDVDAPLVFMADGAADALREDCRAGFLVCPIPDCPDPRYVARGGSRRHHFAHRADGAGGHAPERFFHVVGKHLLAAWVRRRHSGLHVAVEAPVETGQIADVLVTSPRTGKRIALELQYSPLSVEQWTTRDDGYRSAGIEPVWLWGHVPPHLKPVRGLQAGGAIKLAAVHEALHRRGGKLRWFHPDLQAVATGPDERQQRAVAHLGYVRGRARYAPECVPLFDALDDCCLTAEGMSCPADQRLIDAVDAHERAVARERVRQAEAQARAKEQARREAERAAQDAENFERRRRWAHDKQQQEAADWAQERGHLAARFAGGTVPAVLEQSLPGDSAIWTPAGRWHVLLWLRFFEGQPGRSWTVKQIAAWLVNEFRHADHAGKWRALDELLLHLSALGMIDIEHGANPALGLSAATVAAVGDAVWPTATGELYVAEAPDGRRMLVDAHGELGHPSQLTNDYRSTLLRLLLRGIEPPDGSEVADLLLRGAGPGVDSGYAP